ncbi:MAG TPA: spherulation-specific family 4 protein [Nevskiaceae bacterium]|nr:spherulation-specific family 4 protein [Nevskiaceae bacterium]
MRPAACMLLLAALAPLPARAAGLLVPAYFYPNATGINYWMQLPAAGAVPLTAILNPNNGPGSSTDPQYTAALAQVHAAGGRVTGYVHTQYGARAAATVQGEVDQYAALYNVDGIFVDEMSSQSADVPYYAALYAYIKNRNAAWNVVGNPGTNTVEDYLKPATRGADTLVIYEDKAAHLAAFAPAAWTANYSADHFAAIIHTQPDANAMRAELGAASLANVGWVYITDDVLPNPYDTLPSYWNAEIAALAPAAPAANSGGGAWGSFAVPLLLLALRAGQKRFHRTGISSVI